MREEVAEAELKTAAYADGEEVVATWLDEAREV
jgi:hypothetical protein